jgi:uncharacterized membrane protein
MNVMDTAKERAKHIVETVSEKVTEKVGEKVTTESRKQAITIARPRHEVIALFQDTERLSVVFGDAAEVQQAGPERLRWVFAIGGNDRFIWDCVVSMEDDARLRFADLDPGSGAEIVLNFRDAPQERGTEVIAQVTSPGPGALSGALAFKALYRARALLLTGEVPTIEYNPSARNSDR